MNIELTLPKALLGFLLPLIVILSMVLAGIDIFIALIFASAILMAYGLFLGAKWKYIEEVAIAGVASVLSPVIVVLLVGAVIGVWMASGSVPAMLYYGLKIVNPHFFLPTAFLVCTITSLATGSCWGTAGTMGVALMGVAAGLGIPLPLAAGAVISGSHVGDKLSPLSDTTLLASASAKSNLYDHIVSMLYDTIPIGVICLVFYTVVGVFNSVDSSLNLNDVTVLTDGLRTQFHISPLMLIPPVLTIILSLKRVPAIAVFGISIFFGMGWAIVFQGMNFTEMCSIAFYGYISNGPVDALNELLSRGGAASMANTIYVSMFSGIFAGLLHNLRILPTLMDQVARFIKSSRGLITLTSLSCVLLMIGGGGQYTTLTLPGVAFHDTFKKYDVHPAVLSRTMENSGTLIGSIIPWDVSGIFLAETLGVPTLVYLPFALLPLLSPLMGIINGWLGMGVFHWDEKVRLTLKRRKD